MHFIITTTQTHDLRSAAAAWLGLSIALLAPASFGAGHFSLRRCAAILLIAGLALLSGKVVARLLRIPQIPGFAVPFEIVAGFLAFSALQLFATVALNLTSARTLCVTTGIVVLSFIATRRLRTDVGGGGPTSLRTALFDMAVLLLLAAIVVLWSREALAAVRSAEATGVFRAWIDYFLHAAEVTYLKNYPFFGHQSLYLADTAQPFYHRGSYALAAAYSRLSGEPSLQSAVYFLMPAGLVMLGLSAYALGSAIAGRTAGCLSAAGLFLLPDASTYGLRNGFFGFHWLTQIAPGSGYAVAAALLAIGLYVCAVSHRRIRLVAGGAALAVLAALFRVHVAVPAVMLFIVLTVLVWRPRQRWITMTALLAVLFAGVLAVMLSEGIGLAPHFLTGRYEPVRFFQTVHSMAPSNYQGLYGQWTAGSGMLWTISLGYLLLLLAGLGIIFPATLLIAGLKLRDAVNRCVTSIPLILFGVYLATILLVPTPAHSDLTDMGHRPFVLVYAVSLVMLVSWGWTHLQQWTRTHPKLRTAAYACIIVLIPAGLSVPLVFGANIQQSTLSWGPSVSVTPIGKDVFDATAYIREHSSPDDRVVASDEDPLALVVALTELQAFVSRKNLYLSFGGKQAAVAASRLSVLKRTREAKSYEQLTSFGTRHGIRWYIAHQNDVRTWPRSVLDRAAFTSGTIRVFDFNRTAARSRADAPVGPHLPTYAHNLVH